MIISSCNHTAIQCFKTHFLGHFNITDLKELRYILKILVKYNILILDMVYILLSKI